MIIAVLDACVLYPANIRDFFMRLTVEDAFRAKWSDDIHEEWIRSLLKNNPKLLRKDLERTKQLMNEYARDCLVEGYEELIGTIDLKDLDDRHVVAAAIKSNAQVIVTFNLRDFPNSELEKYGVASIDPDQFVLELLDDRPSRVKDAFSRQLRALKNPPYTEEELLDSLARNGLKESMKVLRSLLGESS